jgi:UDP:flavonoid glycosyltransferase YjiC (YdhE family)
VLAAGSGSDVELVLVRPDASVTRRPLPPGVLTTEWVAFPAVLPAAAGLVHHGGAGTLMTALSCGVPQLVFPGAGDRRVNAGLLTARGAGLSVELPDLDRATLERLARDGSLREAAAEVAAEMAAMPHPSDVVPVLAGLAATGRESSFRRR